MSKYVLSYDSIWSYLNITQIRYRHYYAGDLFLSLRVLKRNQCLKTGYFMKQDIQLIISIILERLKTGKGEEYVNQNSHRSCTEQKIHPEKCPAFKKAGQTYQLNVIGSSQCTALCSSLCFICIVYVSFIILSYLIVKQNSSDIIKNNSNKACVSKLFICEYRGSPSSCTYNQCVPLGERLVNCENYKMKI